MTTEQRVRVDRLERYLIADKDKIYTRVRVDDLDTVLSLIKQLESEKEIHVGLEHQYKKEYLDMLDLTKKYKRQIDLMAKIFYKRFKAELLLEYGFESEEQLKQYFTNKVNSKIQ